MAITEVCNKIAAVQTQALDLEAILQEPFEYHVC